jgi:hypothetical protein
MSLLKHEESKSDQASERAMLEIPKVQKETIRE